MGTVVFPVSVVGSLLVAIHWFEYSEYVFYLFSFPVEPVACSLFFNGESRNEIATMQEVRNTRGGKKVGCITVYMCVGVVVLYGLVQTFLKEASTWSATKRQNAYCV
jgi:hypothetical protein